MKVSLTPELERWLQEKVNSGLYNNASEVICEALRLLYAHDQDERLQTERLRHRLEAGLQDIEAGRFAPFTAELVQEIKSKLPKHPEGDEP